MAEETTVSTEEHIKSVAKRIFIEKGYAATTTRDIAEAAETNVALINYYFRSKEKLFKEVFLEAHREFLGTLVAILNKDVPLKEKIELLIERDVEFLLENPDISVFVLNEIRQNAHEYLTKINLHENFPNSLFFKQVEVAVANGEMREVSPFQCVLLVLSNLQFPFIAKPMVLNMARIDENGFRNFILHHKKVVKEMILGYLFS